LFPNLSEKRASYKCFLGTKKRSPTKKKQSGPQVRNNRKATNVSNMDSKPGGAL
jgi:hypothetical protein